MIKGLASGTVHKIPDDLRKAIAATPHVRALWDDISPLARNEWICWVISGKKAETRDIRIKKGALEDARRYAQTVLLGWLHASHR